MARARLTPSFTIPAISDGTTIHGGTDGDGTVFELTPDGTETVLDNFTGGSDGEKDRNPFPT